MKHYFSFAILFIALIVAYFFASYFDSNINFSVPHIASIEMPKFEKNNKDIKGNINIDAFRNNNAFNPHSLGKKEYNLILNMIYIGGTSKSCVINGLSFKEGEHRGNIKVIKIERNRVFVKVNKKLKWLNLKVVANEKS